MAKIQISAEGLVRLQEELHDLKAVKRREVADRIDTARSYGDLSENAEYSAAKEEQAQLEGRIAEIESHLRHAEVIEEAAGTDVVRLGLKVTLQNLSDKSTVTFVVTGSAEANFAQGRISNESPVGRALLGHREKETVTVQAPSGNTKYKIMKIERA